MTEQEFAEMITKRADERVQKRIRILRADITSALVKFGVNNRGYCNDIGPSTAKILAALGSDNPSKGWPSILWRKEEKVVRDELLGILDELQRARLALSREPDENDCKPEVERKA